MKAVHYTVSWTIRLIVDLLCRVEGAELLKVPRTGPLIIVTNHINFLEVPVLYTRLMPRHLTALVKAETWNNPALGFLGTIWSGIPISRGVVDRQAISMAKHAMAKGEILFIAPEGTRSGTGVLGKGSPGVVMLAADTGVPVLPVMHHGGESFWTNARKFRRTQFTVRVGEPFLVETAGAQLTRSIRREIIEDIMRSMAALLPPAYRGDYTGEPPNRSTYLRPFDPAG